MHKNIGKFMFLLKKSRHQFEHDLRVCGHTHGISGSEASVLLFFGNNPDFNNAKDAVCFRGFSKAYVSKAINDLEKRGFISEVEDEKDHRYQHIIIYDKAKDTLIDLQEIQLKSMSFMKRNIDKKDFDTFMKVVNQMADNLIEQEKERHV